MTIDTHDGGECFFHTQLMDLLHQQYGHGMYAMEYRSEHWSHPVYLAFWRIYTHVGRPNPILHALWIVSIHEAPADRSTQMAGISDATRQAFYAYRDHFFHRISQDEHCYYPRHHHGELAVRIDSTRGSRATR